MKTTILATTLALLTTSFASPTLLPRTQQFFTINLANDVSGANAIRSVTVNSGATTFSSLFNGTALEKNGRIIATSLQNVMPVGGNVECVVKSPNGRVDAINDQKTFVDLDGVDGKAVETDVSDFTITCEL